MKRTFRENRLPAKLVRCLVGEQGITGPSRGKTRTSGQKMLPVHPVMVHFINWYKITPV